MEHLIAHDDEPKANDIRKRLGVVSGIGQRTYTPTQIVVDRAKGCRLWTVDGKELLDFTSGVLVANLGHSHDGFEAKYAEYCGAMPRTSYNMVTEIEVVAAERLIGSMKANSRAEKVLWAASGSEGIQKAMWAAMHKHPERPIFLATRFGFHGKKGLAGDVTGDVSPNPNVRFISFPMQDEHPPEYYEAELDALAREFPEKIALLITEPYLGAKGSFHPPKWYHRLLQDWCNRHDVAFIFDEVQACHGRTGHMYAHETYGVEPDLVVLGKGLANGEPAAAVVGRATLIDSLNYGEASDTFSGNPRACAAVCATLDIFEQEKIVENCTKAAAILRKGLAHLRDEFDFITDVRGEGLVYGVEMEDAEAANRCVLEAYHGTEKGGVHFLGPLAGKVLRVSPPLIISESEINVALGVLRGAWSRVGSIR
jgi:4-aminobutyrate aminotransferase-like enzyme